MRSLGTRRVALFAGAAAASAVALTGCSAGQVAETAQKAPSTHGVNVDNADGSVALRGLAVTYRSPKGYLSGGNAPLELSMYNQTRQPITVQVASQPAARTDEKAGVVSARSAALVGPAPSAVPAAPDASAAAGQSADPAAPDPSGAPDPAAGPDASAAPDASPTAARPGVKPAQITIAPLDSVIFRADDTETLQLIGLSGPLVPGNSVNLTFAFSNGAPPLTVQAPMAIPLSPAPRGSAHVEEATEGEGH
jgi:hypothetical protein